MKYSYLPVATLGLISGYLSFEYSLQSNAYMNLAIMILLFSFLVLILIRSDRILIGVCKFVIIFTIFFIGGNIYYSNIASHRLSGEVQVSGIFKVSRIVDRNGYGEVFGILSVSTSTFIAYDDAVRFPKNVVLISFSRDKYLENKAYEVKGILKFENYILPSYQSASQISSRSVQSYDSLSRYKSVGVSAMLQVSESQEYSDSKSGAESGAVSKLEVLRGGLKQSISAIIDNNTKPGTSIIIKAMSLGDDSKLSKETVNNFKLASISHVLVLSGQNIIIFMSIIALVTIKQTKYFRIIISLAAFSLYATSVEIEEPLIRAGLIVLYVLSASLITRRISYKYALWLVIMLIAVVNPELVISSISLQLSIIAAGSIIYFTTPIKDILDEYFPNYLSQALAVTLSVNVLLAPFLLFIFGVYNILSVVANLVVAPIAFMIIAVGSIWMVLGQITYLLEYLLSIDARMAMSYLSKPIAILSELLVSTIKSVAEFFAQNTWYINAPISFTILISYYIIVIVSYSLYLEYKKLN